MDKTADGVLPKVARREALTELSEEERLFRETVRRFAEEKVRPLLGDLERAAEVPKTLWDDLFESGLMGIEVAPQYGGGGRCFFHVVLAIEGLARVDPAVAVCVDVQNVLVNRVLQSRWASPDQRHRYLPRLACDTVGAFALSEAEAGSDAFSLATMAGPNSSGYLLNGHKKWATNGAEAGLYVVFANASPERGKLGVSAFLVERTFPGVTVGRRADKLGVRASSTCDILLDGVQVPRNNLLGKVGAGYDIAIEALSVGRIGIGAQMVGLAQGAFDAALTYAQERRQFGEPIATFQAVHFSLARMATEIEAARLLVYNAARMVEARTFAMQLLRPAAMAKYFASQVAERVASEALEIFGGNGFIKDFPAEKFYRDAKVGKLYEGTSNMLLRTIAGTLLKTLR